MQQGKLLSTHMAAEMGLFKLVAQMALEAPRCLAQVEFV